MTRMTELRQAVIVFFRVIVSAAFFLMMAELLSSCEHKELCYDHPHRQNVEVTFDWSEAPDANPATMSLYLYPDEGGEPIRYEFTDKNGETISVPAGTYHAICVNSDKETHRINGKEKFNTFEVTSAETQALQGLLASMAKFEPRARGTEKERVMLGPAMLYSAHAERVVIKPAGEMSTITMKPKSRVKYFSVEIKNVENIRSVKAMSASLSGLSGGWLAGIDQLSSERVTIPFALEVDPSLTIVRGKENLFGHCQDSSAKHVLMVYAQLTDDSNWFYEVDVTDQVHAADQEEGAPIKIELDKLPFPESVPGGSGLQPSVNKWNEVQVDINL